MSAIADARKSLSDVGFAFVAGSTSPLAIVAARTDGRAIRVLSAWVSAASAVNVNFESGTTDISGLYYLSATDLNLILPYNPFGWFQTAANTKLDLTLSGVVVCNVGVTYIAV